MQNQISIEDLTKIVDSIAFVVNVNPLVDVATLFEEIQKLNDSKEAEKESLKHELIIPEEGAFGLIVDMQSPTNKRSSKKYDWNNKLHFMNWEKSMERRGFKIIGYHNIED